MERTGDLVTGIAKVMITGCAAFSTTLALVTTIAQADDFDSLPKKQEAAAAKNPFADRKAHCESKTAKGITKEAWQFRGTGRFTRTLIDVSMLQSGKYTVEGDRLKATTSSGLNWDYKTKMTKDGFQYILEAPETGEKSLYVCIWTK